jgi:hypothetical protein
MPGSKGKCKGCKAELVWAVNPMGKGVPLDPDPVDDGAHVIEGHLEDGRPQVRRLADDEVPAAGVQRHDVHRCDEFAKLKEETAE